MTKYLSYAESEKFRAEAHKQMGLILCTPLALSLLKVWVDAKDLNLDHLFFTLPLFIFGFFSVNYSYVIMKRRDEKYVRQFVSYV